MFTKNKCKDCAFFEDKKIQIGASLIYRNSCSRNRHRRDTAPQGKACKFFIHKSLEGPDR